MNDRGQLEVRWRAWQDKTDGDWHLVDCGEERLISVPEVIGRVLYSRHDLWCHPPDAAVQIAHVSPGPTQPFVDLDLLGGRVRVVSDCAPVIEHVTKELASAVSTWRCTADAIVHFSDESSLVRFMRALDDGGRARPGVKWRDAWSPDWQHSDTGLPAVPPFCATVYAGRFLCLHAATLALDSSRGLIICGERGSGKTSATLWATNKTSLAVLSDEATFIELRTLAVLGLPLPVGLASLDGKQRFAPSQIMRFHAGAVRAVSVVILEKGEESGLTRPIDVMEAVHWMLPHLRNTGNSLDTDIVAIRRLCGDAPVYKLIVPTWPDLQNAFNTSLRTVIERCP